jgi:hypothetical protein
MEHAKMCRSVRRSEQRARVFLSLQHRNFEVRFSVQILGELILTRQCSNESLLRHFDRPNNRPGIGSDAEKPGKRSFNSCTDTAPDCLSSTDRCDSAYCSREGWQGTCTTCREFKKDSRMSSLRDQILSEPIHSNSSLSDADEE